MRITLVRESNSQTAQGAHCSEKSRYAPAAFEGAIAGKSASIEVVIIPLGLAK
jgi:hypothetical protein